MEETGALIQFGSCTFHDSSSLLLESSITGDVGTNRMVIYEFKAPYTREGIVGVSCSRNFMFITVKELPELPLIPYGGGSHVASLTVGG
jgi:hypothetical protein